MLSYQSLMPAGAGTPRYEKLELWLGAANWHGGFCHAPHPTQRGTSPSPRISPHYIPPERRIQGSRMPKWGGRVDVGGGIAVDVLSRNVTWILGSSWIPAPVRGTMTGREIDSEARNAHFRTNRSMPGHQGDEKRSCDLVGRVGAGILHVPPQPQRGTSPRATLALGRLLPISTDVLPGFVRGFPPPRERQLRGLVGFKSR